MPVDPSSKVAVVQATTNTTGGTPRQATLGAWSTCRMGYETSPARRRSNPWPNPWPT